MLAAQAHAEGPPPVLVGDAPDGLPPLKHWAVRLPRAACAGPALNAIDRVVPRRIRTIGSAKLVHWGLPGLVDTAAVLISELVTNAYQHGSASHVEFRMCLTRPHVTIEVEDGTPRRPILRDAGEFDEGGRGLLLVDDLATRWGYANDATTTWCILDLPDGEVTSC